MHCSLIIIIIINVKTRGARINNNIRSNTCRNVIQNNKSHEFTNSITAVRRCVLTKRLQGVKVRFDPSEYCFSISVYDGRIYDMIRRLTLCRAMRS